MMTYKKACRMVAEGFDSESLKYGKKFDRDEAQILRNVLNVESKIFNIFVKNQKCSFKSFPFEDINPGYSMDKKVAVLIAKLLFAEGWTPSVHVANTRKRYESVTNGFW